jgi:hypothetical protein
MNTKQNTIAKRLRPYGMVLDLTKFLDLLRYEEVLDHLYLKPSRNPRLGGYRVVERLLRFFLIRSNSLSPLTKPIYICSVPACQHLILQWLSGLEQGACLRP